MKTQKQNNNLQHAIAQLNKLIEIKDQTISAQSETIQTLFKLREGTRQYVAVSASSFTFNLN